MTQGKKLSSDSIKGRVFEANFGDLTQGQTATKKIKLIVDEAADGKEAKTNFYGLDTTRDHLCGLIKKWHTLIETFVDCKTSDGFVLRFFVICFTAKTQGQLSGLCKAQNSQVKLIRQIINKLISRTCKKSTLKEMVSLVLGDTLTHDMEKKCKKIFPIENCTIRKIKTIKRPKFDLNQFNQMQADSEVAGVHKEEEEKKDEKKQDVTEENQLK